MFTTFTLAEIKNYHHLFIVVGHRWQNIFDRPLHQNSSNHSKAFPITVNLLQRINYQPVYQTYCNTMNRSCHFLLIHILHNARTRCLFRTWLLFDVLCRAGHYSTALFTHILRFQQKHVA